jgi:FkbM family methyltransferase
MTTQSKLRIARLLYRALKLAGFKDQTVVRRSGVRFNLDLREGIDLSVFLFGGFQRHVAPGRLFQIPPDAMIFDVGANVGSVCLPLAAALPHSTVYAFEPTDYAFEKLRSNISLNPDLQTRVHPFQMFVSSRRDETSELAAFSSWRVDTLEEGDLRHTIHGGTQKPATKKQTSLDDFIVTQGIERVDFIKIDTDGHELEVLCGATNTMRRFKPVIIFELTKYLLRERGVSFADYESLLAPLGYKLLDTRSGQRVSGQSIEKVVPNHGGIDVLALPGS